MRSFALLSLLSGSLIINSGVASPILATRTTANPLPYNVAQPGATPAFLPLPSPVLLTITDTLALVGAATGFATGSQLGTALVAELKSLASAGSVAQKTQLQALEGVIGGLFGGLVPNPATSSSKVIPTSTSTTNSATATPAAITTCLGAGTTEKQINSLFSYGGVGTTVYLCPATLVNTANPIQFSAANQTLTTQGTPLATILVTGAVQTVAVSGYTNYANLSYVAIDGNRPALGFYSASLGGGALIEMGGNTVGQVIEGVKGYEPRSWSTLHGIEGTGNSCSGMTSEFHTFETLTSPVANKHSAIVINNILGPSGSSTAGQYADGISLACKDSVVTGNTITDATDGAIVIFGAPGSQVYNNTIIASTRVLLGGINMVDYAPFSGNYTGTDVRDNTLTSSSVMIHSGISIGSLVWGSYNYSGVFTHGGTVKDNTLTSGSTGYFGYGISIAGNIAPSVPGGNKFVSANFGGVNATGCIPGATPPAGPLYRNPYTSGTPVGGLQAGFVNATFEYLICTAPQSPPTIVGYSN